MKLFYLFNPTSLISGRHYKHLIRLTIIHTCTISTSMTTSSATFIASIGKKEANILGISIKQLLIPNSDFFSYTHAHTQILFLVKSITHYPNSYVEILTPNARVLRGGAFGRHLGQEGGVLRRGVSALRKETQQCSPTPPTKWGQNEKLSVCDLEKALTRIWPNWPNSDLWLMASRITRNKFLFKPSCLRHFAMAVQANTGIFSTLNT